MKSSHLPHPTAIALIATAISLIPHSHLLAAAGALDPSFGGDGIALATAGGGANGLAVAIQNDGKIVVAGQYFNVSNYDIFLARFNDDGTPDNTFSGDGIATAALSPGNDSANAVAIQSNDRIVVAGSVSVGSDNDFLVMRYKSNGTLDSSFSGDGIQTTNFDGTHAYNDVAQGIAIQPNGRIVVVGKTDVTGGFLPNNDFAVARYTSAGTLDSTFSGDGKTTTPFGNNHDFANAVALQSDGKIVVAGEFADIGGNRRFALSRYHASGGLDSAFSTDGKVTTSLAGFIDVAYGVAIDPTNGTIVAAGRSSNGSVDRFGITRYRTNGTLDPSFSGDGKQITGFGALSGSAMGVAFQPNGKIVCVGTRGSSIALVRYHAGGSLDTTFGSGGIVTTSVLSGSNGMGVVIQKDGRIVVGGQNYDGITNYLTATRYLSPPQADARVGASMTVPTGNDRYNLTGNGQIETLLIQKGGHTRQAFIGIQNDGATSGKLKVSGSAGNSKFTIRYFKGSQDVTTAVVAGSYTTPLLPPGGILKLKARITAVTAQANQQRECSIRVETPSGASKDVAVIKAVSR